MSLDLQECRICFDIETYANEFISPCMCKGTSKYVHKNCLNTWRTFNRDTVGWSKCMECNCHYTFRYKYPIESLTIFPPQNMLCSFIVHYIGMLLGGYIIWLFEKYDGYLAIRMLNFNQTFHKPSILYYVKENELFSQIFYFSYAMFFQSLAFYLYFFYKSYNNINRKKIYFRKIRNTVGISVLFTLQFLICYYSLNNFPVIFINIVSVVSILEPFVRYNIITEHCKIITILNNDNTEEILSYVENPLNGMLMRNIVIVN
jgi:hypothetical protein